MPYSVVIKNEQGEPIGGTIYYFDANGTEIGQTVVPPAGVDLDVEMVESASRYRVVSPGYGWYGTATIYDSNVFTLVKKPDTLLSYTIGAVAGFLIAKIIKL